MFHKHKNKELAFSNLLKGITCALAGFLSLQSAQAAPQELTIYTYESFTSSWGPGPQIEQAFEAECNCDLKFVALDDAVSILNRLKLEGKHTKADIALGLDQNLLERARSTDLFTAHKSDLTQLDLLSTWSDNIFLPFDYGYFAFIYDETKTQKIPQSLHDLVYSSDATLVIQDPRTSSPGLGLLLWMKSVFGDQANEAWAKLAPRIVTTTKGWSEAYGIFLKGEADMVLSYTTSPAYHQTVEQETKYKAAPFSEGHYQQIEVAAQLKTSKNPELAKKFLDFMMRDKFQSIIPTTNWMLPVRTPSKGLPSAFLPANIHYPTTSLSIPPKEIEGKTKSWVNEWLNAMSQ